MPDPSVWRRRRVDRRDDEKSTLSPYLAAIGHVEAGDAQAVVFPEGPSRVKKSPSFTVRLTPSEPMIDGAVTGRPRRKSFLNSVTTSFVPTVILIWKGSFPLIA
jgi:hypothetical protein